MDQKGVKSCSEEETGTGRAAERSRGSRRRNGLGRKWQQKAEKMEAGLQ